MPTTSRLAVTLAIALPLFLQSISAAAQGKPGGNTGGGTTPTTGKPTRNPEQIPDNRTMREDRPIFLSGKVVLEDGSPLPQAAVIERLCTGTVRREAYTSASGDFAFQVGQSAGVLQDASIGGLSGVNPMGMPNISEPRSVLDRNLLGCELRAVLPGFISNSVPINLMGTEQQLDVGRIVLRRMGKTAAALVSATSLMAPNDARKAFDKGRKAAAKEKLGEAQKELEKAVRIYPKFALAWLELGRVYERQKQIEQARKSYSEAAASDGQLLTPYLQLALLAAGEAKWQELADFTERALRVDSANFPMLHFYNAVANYNLNRLDQAEKSARKAQQLDMRHGIPRADLLMGMILKQRGDYSGAADQIRNYLKFVSTGPDAASARSQLQELEEQSARLPQR